MARGPLSNVPELHRVRFVRAPNPLRLPGHADKPQSTEHLAIRTFLYLLLRYVLGASHSVGSEQFVYWNASNPRRCLSPDVFVLRNRPQEHFGSWKTWERGTPEIAVEIVSPNEGDGFDW